MLPTNYQNEILNNAMSNRRQYRIIENNNGTVSFVDVSVYDREGSLFDADDVNEICETINLNITNISAIQELLQTGVVNGIKGSAETGNYRVGEVTISAADVGTLTEAEIRALISGGGGGIGFAVVDELPTTDISTTTIYLVPSTNTRARNAKDEYVYIISSHYLDISTSYVVVEDYESLPSEGDSTLLYITKDDEKAYSWVESISEYVEKTSITVSVVESLPTNGEESIIYVLSSDDSVYEWVVSGDWEQIGSTSVNLSNYYTKTEIDTGALISSEEFQAL